MKRLTASMAAAALVLSACGAASPSAAKPTSAPVATPGATAAPAISPTPGTATIEVTFDGETCSAAGPAVVEEGTMIQWVFENTPAAIEASNAQDAMSIGSDLIIIPTVDGTTWEAVQASRPAPDGTKGNWPDPAWALMDDLDVAHGPSAIFVTTATSSAYVVMCNVYWNYDGETPFAFHVATMVQVLGG
jgi:hypothetical protein